MGGSSSAWFSVRCRFVFHLVHVCVGQFCICGAHPSVLIFFCVFVESRSLAHPCLALRLPLRQLYVCTTLPLSGLLRVGRCRDSAEQLERTRDAASSVHFASCHRPLRKKITIGQGLGAEARSSKEKAPCITKGSKQETVEIYREVSSLAQASLVSQVT